MMLQTHSTVVKTDMLNEREPKMTAPKIAQEAPYLVEVEAGKTYHWCACGHSKKQPYCDGSHNGSSFAPIVYIAEKAGKVAFCGCKHSKKKPLCDGSHKTLGAKQESAVS
jgi:CDGSH-type Zn-finger protein